MICTSRDQAEPSTSRRLLNCIKGVAPEMHMAVECARKQRHDVHLVRHRQHSDPCLRHEAAQALVFIGRGKQAPPEAAPGGGHGLPPPDPLAVGAQTAARVPGRLPSCALRSQQQRSK